MSNKLNFFTNVVSKLSVFSDGAVLIVQQEVRPACKTENSRVKQN